MAENETGSLGEEIRKRLNRRDNKLAIATNIVEGIKKGDKSAYNFVVTLLEDKDKASDEEKLFPLNDKQLTEIILLFADRIRGSGTNRS